MQSASSNGTRCNLLYPFDIFKIRKNAHAIPPVGIRNKENVTGADVSV
jgi:hypothetical protein